MNQSLIILLVFGIEVFIKTLSSSFEKKYDIVRIWYDDIPFLYVVGPIVMYYLILFQLVGMKSITLLVFVHLIAKSILRFIAVYLKERYDYFHLLVRYNESVPIYQLITSDVIYIVGLLLIYRFSSIYLQTKHLNTMVCIIAYIGFTLTFEDV